MLRAVSKVSCLLLLAAVAMPMTNVVAQESSRATDRAWMGLYIRDLDTEDTKALDLKKGTRGVVVSGMDDEGPAARAGLEPGDVITALDGRSIRDRADFMAALEKRQPGDRVRLEVLRDSKARTYEFDLANRPTILERDALFRGSGPQHLAEILQIGGPRLGVKTLDLESADLASYFGVGARQGVLISEVIEGSGAEEAGLKPGDVILSVGESKVGSTQELLHALADFDHGERVTLEVQRKNAQMEIEVELGEGFNLSRLGMPRRYSGSVLLNDDVADLRRELRELKRELRELEREMRSYRGK